MKQPAGLSHQGKALWQDITKDHVLTPVEFQLLAQACHTVDLIDRLRKELDKSDLVVQGYNKQPVANQLLTEIRGHRTTLGSLLRQLQIPDSDDTGPSITVTRVHR